MEIFNFFVYVKARKNGKKGLLRDETLSIFSSQVAIQILVTLCFLLKVCPNVSIHNRYFEHLTRLLLLLSTHGGSTY